MLEGERKLQPMRTEPSSPGEPQAHAHASFKLKLRRADAQGQASRKLMPMRFLSSSLGKRKLKPLSDLVSILERLLKVKANREVMKLPRNGDVQFTHANISFASRELGYKPSTDLQTGLKKFVRWYLSYYGNGKKSNQ
ncbi:putative UDP-glucuronate 5-epimerase [Heracleum sosnowskyi]|uniref:UDP-glucuronate 5-epimerase n=1 Tax=Heracleum sosnowskyi TaxID=360622 RepID=A0AAD8JB90_9APIA|nr:putative UDP-glucuronate 5-epimerase [Heracleum sosnowskyi]